MMNPRKSLAVLLLLISLSSFLLRPGCAEGNAEEDLDPCGPDNLAAAPEDMSSLEMVCRCSPNKILCMSTAESVSPGLNSTTTNAVDVLKLHVEAARRNVAAAKSSAEKLINDPKTNAATKPILKGCIADYDAAARCFESADRWMGAGAVVGNLSSAGAEFEKCDDSFKAAKLAAPLIKYTETNLRIADNYLGIYTKYWQIPPSEMPAPPPKPTGPKLDDKLVKAICSKLSHVDANVCTSSIRSAGVSDAVSFVELTIDETIKATVPALEEMNSLTTGDLNKDCYQGYREAAGDLVQAKREIGRSRLLDARKRIESAAVNYRKCRSAFVRAYKSTEIPDYQEKLETLADKTVVIFDTFWPNVGGVNEDAGKANRGEL